MTENSSRLKSVRRIIVLGGEPAPADAPPVKKKKKKQTWLLRPLEKAARTLVRAQHAAAEEYLERHERSARREKDGWVIDLGRNAGRAFRAGVKRLKLPI